MEILNQPLPWYVAGPLIGLMLPLLWYISNKTFGISSSFRHACAPIMPKKISYFNYDWKKDGMWNLKFVIGIVIGGLLAGLTISGDYRINLAESTLSHLQTLGISDTTGLIPASLFNWEALTTPIGWFVMVFGGLLVGFGARYAGGCTSGHAITGLAMLQKASLIAVIGFFVGGIITTYLILPNLLGG